MPTPASTIGVEAINNSGRVAGVYIDQATNQPRVFLYNGHTVSAFIHYDNFYGLTVRMNNLGVILLNVSVFGSKYPVSYLLVCTGAGC
jgi:hypothetical protein